MRVNWASARIPSHHKLQATRALPQVPTFHAASAPHHSTVAHSLPGNQSSTTLSFPSSRTETRMARQDSTTQPPIVVPQAKDGQVWYFAYGSNMNLRVLRDRRKVTPVASLPAKLDNYVLGFNLFGVPYMEPGMATIHPITPNTERAARAVALPPVAQAVADAAAASTARIGTTKTTPENGTNGHAQNGSNGHAQNGSSNGHAADAASAGSSEPPALTSQEAFAMRVSAGLHGVLHLVSADHWEIVKATEGVRLKGIGYQVVHVKCTLYDGQQVEALTLQAAPVSVGDNARILPSRRYMNIIREGAREMGVDPAFCDMLDIHPAYEPPSETRVSIAKWAMAGTALGIMMPLMPLLAGAAAYKGAARMLGWSSSDASQAPTPPSASKPDPTPADGLASPRHKEQATPGATVLEAKPQQPPATEPDKPAGETGGAAQPSSSAAAKDSAASNNNQKTSQDKPPPMFVIFQAVRGLLDPRVMSLYTWGVFRGLWLVHDYALSPVLGSGKDNNSKVQAMRSGKQ